MKINPSLVLFVPLLSAHFATAADALLLDVRAGERARRDVPIRWEVPSRVQLPVTWRLVEAASGEEVPAQLESGAAPALVWIVSGELPAGSLRRYRLEAAPKAGPAEHGGDGASSHATRALREERRGADAIAAFRGASEVFVYNAGSVAPPRGVEPAFARSGYLHPLRAPSGRVVTNDFPLNHKHHHGVWMPWSQTELEGRAINFWEQASLEGKVECLRATPIAGAVLAGVSAEHRFTELKGGTPVLEETWTVVTYATRGPSLIDFTSVQRCVSSSPLTLKQYRYGGFGFRGAAEWEGAGGCEFLTSQGKTRRNGHETAAWWCDIVGKVDGELAGVAFLCHPSSPRAPQNMRIHDTEPFFNFTPCQDGDLELRPGETLVSRYRMVLHDGRLDAAELDRLWWDYAKPPRVILVRDGTP